MPSVRLTPQEEQAVSKKRSFYGGKGDKLHLGGFTNFDTAGVSANLFNYMIGVLAVKSFIDVGCGKGFSTKYFHDRSVKVLCVEGSHDAVTQSLLPQNKIVEHDFSRGEWWPEETFDVAWSVEFLEHVGRQYMHNYLPIFHKSAMLFVTASGWGGWHHVEVHDQMWWRLRMAAQGFIYSDELTETVRGMAKAGRNSTSGDESAHLIHSMMVFINPRVASMPQHHHLIGGNGCYGNKINNRDGGVPCTGEDALPARYEALLECKLTNDFFTTDCKTNPRAAPIH